MQRSKIASYLGFAKKSGYLRAGANVIATLKKANLIIVSEDASENAKKDAKKYSDKFACPLVLSAIPAEEITGKENCKTIAVTEENLAKAILDNLDENFTIISGGRKE